MSDGGISKHHHQYEKHINELKYKILHDTRFNNNKGDDDLSPYLKKRNRRYKSIYEAIHGHQSHNGHRQWYQQLPQTNNEIPDDESLTKLLKSSLKSIKGEFKHHKNHHLSKSQHKIKKLRSRPEAGIMQKKLKI